MVELSYPYLLLLLPLPLLLRRFLPPYREKKLAVRTPFFEDLSQILGDGSKIPSHKTSSLLVYNTILGVCWVLLLLAVARPQYIEEPLTKNIATRDLLLAVDLSTSMDTRDFTNAAGQTVDRLEAVKEVLDEFLTRREGDRVGLILFAMAPFVQVPFTEDLTVCRELLHEAQVGMAGPQTMIGDAIGLGITIFEKSEVEDKTLILLTDGNDTGSRIPPEEAAKVAAGKGIVIHTIAVGDPVAAGEAKLDEESLKAIAVTAGGQYFLAKDRRELEEIYIRLDEIDTREVESIRFQPKRDLFYWPLSLLLLISFTSCLIEGIQARKRIRRGGNHG